MMTDSLIVAALYKFARFDDPAALRQPLLQVCVENGIKGTILLAREGVNGTIAGTAAGIAAIVGHIRALPGCADLDVKYSHAETPPFYRMKVRIKKEIVTLGVPGIDPTKEVGIYVQPQEWNALIADPNTILIDTRNDYEVAIGTFKGAVDPHTVSFSDFPEWFRANRAALTEGRNQPKIAMFCTGGIRCEKSTAFVKAEGLEDVYHLQGGILRYLEEMSAEKSLWEGECFVFDQRVSVGHGLELGSYAMCHACRRPLRSPDLQSPLYVKGISCPACHDERDEAQRKRYAERERQVAIAARKGQPHIGTDPRVLDKGEIGG